MGRRGAAVGLGGRGGATVGSTGVGASVGRVETGTATVAAGRTIGALLLAPRDLGPPRPNKPVAFVLTLDRAATLCRAVMLCSRLAIASRRAFDAASSGSVLAILFGTSGGASDLRLPPPAVVEGTATEWVDGKPALTLVACVGWDELKSAAALIWLLWLP